MPYYVLYDSCVGYNRPKKGQYIIAIPSCDIPNLDKFTLTLFMAIADRERELISLRTKQALDQKRLLGWRVA